VVLVVVVVVKYDVYWSLLYVTNCWHVRMKRWWKDERWNCSSIQT